MAETKTEFDQTQCQPCLKKDVESVAKIFCTNCSEFQCKDCLKGHDIYALLSNHKLISVSEGHYYVSSMDGDGFEETTFICTKHKKQFEFYCQTDDEFLCSKCAIISHNKCENIVDIENMDGHRGCEKLKNEFVSAINSTCQVTELLEEADTRLLEDISALSDKLKDMKSRVIQIFDDFSKAILTQATAYSNTTKTDLAGKRAKCEAQVGALKKQVRRIDSIMNTGTPAEKFITERRMQQCVKDTTTLKNEMSSVEIRCLFGQQFQHLNSELSFLKSETLDISFRLPAPSTLQLVKSVKLQQLQEEKNEPLYSGLDFFPDGRVVVADNKNDKCMIYDANLHIKNSYKLSYPPLSVTAMSNDEVVVTSGDNYRLDFLNVSKTNDITLNRTCKMNAQYDSISMMNDASFLVGTIEHIEPFRIVSLSGDESDVSISLPEKQYSCDKSFCTYIRGREKVVHCDRDDSKIYIYDIKSGKRVVVNNDLIKSPCDVAVGPYDHIVVCSKDTNCLVEITPCGRVLSSHQVDMKYPRYVAISKDRKHLVVSNSVRSDRNLSLYKIS